MCRNLRPDLSGAHFFAKKIAGTEGGKRRPKKLSARRKTFKGRHSAVDENTCTGDVICHVAG